MYRIIIVLVCGMFALACSPVEGMPTEYGKACDIVHDGKTLEVKGYLDAGNGIMCSERKGNMLCGLILKAKSDDDKGFKVNIYTGGGANSMDQIESSYTKSDLNVRGDDGKKIDLEKPVTITAVQGSSNDPRHEWRCSCEFRKGEDYSEYSRV